MKTDNTIFLGICAIICVYIMSVTIAAIRFGSWWILFFLLPIGVAFMRSSRND